MFLRYRMDDMVLSYWAAGIGHAAACHVEDSQRACTTARANQRPRFWDCPADLARSLDLAPVQLSELEGG